MSCNFRYDASGNKKKNYTIKNNVKQQYKKKNVALRYVVFEINTLEDYGFQQSSLISLLPRCQTLVLLLRGVTWHRWHGLVYHSHSARRGHHPHQCPYRGTCSRGCLLLGWSLSVLLLHYFGCTFWNRQIISVLTIIHYRELSTPMNQWVASSHLHTLFSWNPQGSSTLCLRVDSAPRRSSPGVELWSLLAFHCWTRCSHSCSSSSWPLPSLTSPSP